MPRLDIRIKTRDGICPASLFTPGGRPGPWPAVMFFMDGFGVRPVLREMAERLAEGGYAVLLPDLFYRFPDSAPIDPSQMRSDPKLRDELIRRVSSLGAKQKISDGEAFLEFLAGRPEVGPDRFASTGYCMGGNVGLTVAGAFPGRFAAVASFHAGGLATDQPDSPHRFVKNITGGVYVAGAIEDAHFTEEQKQVLEKALTDAGVDHSIETYEGARHGFAIADSPVFDPAAAERHWASLFALLRKAFSADR